MGSVPRIDSIVTAKNVSDKTVNSTIIFKLLGQISTSDQFEKAIYSIITNPNSLKQLQEEMVANRLYFEREDLWTPDILSRKSSSKEVVEHTLQKLSKEHQGLRQLHMLQLLQARAPILSASIQDFLDRVVF